MFGGYISQGVLQSNQQKTIQSFPDKTEKVDHTPRDPKDGLDIGMVEGDEEIFSLKKFSSNIKHGSVEEDKEEVKIAKASQKDKGEIQKSKKDLKQGSGESPLRGLQNFGGLICEESDGSIKVASMDVNSNRGSELTPHFLTGGKGEIPSAEAAILTAQTIVEKDLVEKGKDKYTGLKRCPSCSKIIPTMEKFDNTFADIVVKNEPLVMSVEE